MIPDKYKNTCPLDHSTYEKYIECNCNFGSANEVWYFKEQELAKLKELLKESIPELESYYRSRRMSDWNNGKSEKREILINKIKEALGE